MHCKSNILCKTEEKTVVFHLYEQPSKTDVEKPVRENFSSKTFIKTKVKALEDPLAGNFLIIKEGSSKCYL